MPANSLYTVRQGTRSKLLFGLLCGEGSGEPRRGLTHDTAGAAAHYVRAGEAVAHDVGLAPGQVGEWSAGGFVEVDPDRMPGLYQVGAPDEMLAEGSDRAVLLLRFPGVATAQVEVALVGYDPEDADHIGLRSLDPDYHLRVLRRGMPGLTKLELALWEEAGRGPA